MIEIKDISGGTLLSAPVTEAGRVRDELMSPGQVSLSWDSDERVTLPAGASVTVGGVVYRLLDPYSPDWVNEAAWRYSPVFYDKTGMWGKKPFFLVTDTGEETDWTLTAYPGQFMEAVVRALLKYTGETYTYSVDAEIAQLRMESVTFQNVSILDGLNSIAEAFGTEWWREGSVIHLSRCEYGTPVTLAVGVNVGIPTATKDKEGYFTRFYAFGGTRNITQDYDDGGFTNGLVNKRLTLDPTAYPGGYIDIKPDLQPEETFVKTLIFDDIYPSSRLTISDVRGDLKEYLDGEGNKIQVSEDDEGNPVYQQYTVWYFKIPGLDFDNTTYDEEDNPDGMLLPGLELYVSFESGQLNGRDFKLTYHEDTAEYEIHFVEEGTLVIPGTVTLIPADGDEVILYNIKMPDEYVSSARDELADRLLEEMDKYRKDRNTYSVPSYPTVFEAEGTDLAVGQAVTLVMGGTSLSTRVLSVERQLDFPCVQTITVGEAKIKRNSEEIKEEIIDANQNIDTAKALSDLTKAIQDGYGRVQQLIIQSIAQYRGMWVLNQHGAPTDPTKWTVDTDHTAVSKKDFVAYSSLGEEPEGIFPVVTDYQTTGLFRVKPGGGLRYDPETGGWYVDSSVAGGGGIDTDGLADYLTGKGYVSTSSAKAIQWDDAYALRHEHANKGYLDGIDQYLSTTASPLFQSLHLTTRWMAANPRGDLEITNNGILAAYLSGVNNGTLALKRDLVADGDVVAYASGGPSGGALPVASPQSYGLTRYDNVTLKMNASGQLYVAGGTGGGGSSVSLGGLSGGYRQLSVDGVSASIATDSHTHPWGSITGKPSVLGSIGYRVSGSGNVVTDVTASGGTVYVTKGNVSGGGSWNGGTVSNGITISNYGAVGIHIDTGTPFLRMGPYWKAQSGTDLNLYHGSTKVSYLSGVNKGNMWIAGSLVQGSDMRLKDRLGDLTGALDGIMALDVFRFRYKDRPYDRARIGLSAQRVRERFPELVYTDDDGYLSLDYPGLAPVAIAGIKELAATVEALGREIGRLRRRLDNIYQETLGAREGGDRI